MIHGLEDKNRKELIEICRIQLVEHVRMMREIKKLRVLLAKARKDTLKTPSRPPV